MLWALLLLLGCGRAALVLREDLHEENLQKILKEVILENIDDDCPLYAAIHEEERWEFLGSHMNTLSLLDSRRGSQSVVSQMVRNSRRQPYAAFFINLDRTELIDLNQDPGLQKDFFLSKKKKFLLIQDEFTEGIWNLPGLNNSINVYAFHLTGNTLTLSTICLYCQHGHSTKQVFPLIKL